MIVLALGPWSYWLHIAYLGPLLLFSELVFPQTFFEWLANWCY